MAKKLYKVEKSISDQERSFELGKKTSFVQRHKVLFMFFFLLFIISFLYLGFKSVFVDITDALSPNLPDFVKEQLIQGDEEQELANLKETDTDHDGLTDYQELYQYRTSMFLEDTDSDGYSDKEEVTSGNDPLCPTGEECNVLQFITPETKLSDIVQEVTMDADLSIKEATFREFRQFLLDNGIPQEDVDRLSDSDLMVVLQVVQESQMVAPEEWSEDITPEEVRTFLLSQTNVDHEDVNNLTDEELLEIAETLISE